MRTKLLVQLQRLADQFVERLSAQAGVEGIVLLGSLGKRQFADSFSDIDIGVFLTHLPSPSYLPPFEFFVRSDELLVTFNVHQQLTDDARTEPWSGPKCDAYRDGIIVLDRHGRIASLLEDKAVEERGRAFTRLTEILAVAEWCVSQNPARMVTRGHHDVAHDLLNQGLDLLVEACFLVNDAPPPHRKWRMAKLWRLPWLPVSARSRIRSATIVRGFTARDVARRVSLLNGLFGDIAVRARARQRDFPSAPYQYACQTIWRRQLQPRTFADAVADLFAPVVSGEVATDIRGVVAFELVSDTETLKRVLRGVNMARAAFPESLVDSALESFDTTKW